eukprot:TRINITY_DN38009_c0_g1_i1.p1 TRINITY_DN38009_c0_g1~~TRINITY_DN38009_c0_g1_i1.p1  ORF type:complete len:304 (-),score=52.23 TRINITY_DN38009_c0_g1_i1:98-925(-)
MARFALALTFSALAPADAIQAMKMQRAAANVSVAASTATEGAATHALSPETALAADNAPAIDDQVVDSLPTARSGVYQQQQQMAHVFPAKLLGHAGAGLQHLLSHDVARTRTALESRTLDTSPEAAAENVDVVSAERADAGPKPVALIASDVRLEAALRHIETLLNKYADGHSSQSSSVIGTVINVLIIVVLLAFLALMYHNHWNLSSTLEEIRRPRQAMQDIQAEGSAAYQYMAAAGPGMVGQTAPYPHPAAAGGFPPHPYQAQTHPARNPLCC